ncbi:MAG: HD domain-containing phosphohydrolase [Planctomycetota bacterium]
MLPRTERRARGWSLTRRLTVALSVGTFFVALVLGLLGADREDRNQSRHQAASEHKLAVAFAERAAPLLERNDLMRLSVLAAVVRDQTGGRALLLERGGRVVLDTALILGERQLGLLAASGAFQRTSQRLDGVSVRESLAPIRFGGEHIGEVRLQCEVSPATSGFDFTWFGLAWLSCLTLVVVVAIMGQHWSARVRGATDALIRLSVGEVGGVGAEAPERELQDLGLALRKMELGVQEGLQRVGDGYVAMALQVVEGLESRRLIPPGHGERTAAYAARMAERLQLLAADRSELDRACRLIDLGKAWVRASVLQKQGALTEMESQSLRHHPVRAAEQLECLPGLRRVARIVRHQLERYDGMGLPEGLRGDRIPLGSRIVAIASSFDLLLTCLAEQPLEWREALEQLGRARGEVFDPWLLDLLVEEIEKDPPATSSDRPVMIVPAGSMPWRTAAAEQCDDEETAMADDGCELEVMLDETQHEEAP